MSGTNSGSEDVQATTNVDGGSKKHDAIPVSETDDVGKSDTDDGVAGSEEKEKIEPERTADSNGGLNKTDIDSEKKARRDVTMKSEDDIDSEKEQLKSVESSGSESDGKHQDGQKDETFDKAEESINEKLQRMCIPDGQEKIPEKGNITADSEETGRQENKEDQDQTNSGSSPVKSKELGGEEAAETAQAVDTVDGETCATGNAVLPANADSCADRTDVYEDTTGTESFMASGDIVQPDQQSRPGMSVKEYYSDTYRMDYPNRGKALIINNKTFKGLQERTGTDIDAEWLRKMFTEMGFETETSPNLTKQKMLEDLQKDFVEPSSPRERAIENRARRENKIAKQLRPAATASTVGLSK